jgi:hypothetical protein
MDRCEITELLRDQCAHCRPKPEPSLFALPSDSDVGPAIRSAYDGWCHACSESIDSGDMIRRTHDGWVHEDCA